MFCDKFGDGDCAQLIKNDMIFHSGSICEVEEYCKNKLHIHSYVTAWAELFANAELFGGQSSTSFKIKRKRLIRNFKYVNKFI